MFRAEADGMLREMTDKKGSRLDVSMTSKYQQSPRHATSLTLCSGSIRAKVIATPYPLDGSRGSLDIVISLATVHADMQEFGLAVD